MVSAILLAAGSSRRMGKQNKLLLPWNDQPMIARVAEQIQGSKASEIIVVLGHEAEKVKAALAPFDVQFSYNPKHQSGMTSSIQAGIKTCSPDSRGYLICLGDMPRLQTTDYDTIIEQVSGKKEILAPFYRGQKGNPVFFSRHFKGEILAHTEAEGCKKIVQANALLLRSIPFTNDHILHDIDKPEDYLPQNGFNPFSND